MSTAAHRREAEEASKIFHAAMVAMGAKTLEDALILWQDVPPVPSGRAAEKWLARTVRFVLSRRRRARDLALAYYRLQRALHTGTTIALPGVDNPKFVTLPELRREFERFTRSPESAPEEPSSELVDEAPSDTPEGPQSEAPEDDDEGDDDDRILVEEIERLQQELAQLEAQAEQEIETVLKALGSDQLDKKLGEIDPEQPAKDADALRAKAHREAGNRQAAAAARVAMDGARGTTYHTMTRDKRAIGYVRVSRTGTPCGWCAMLISRGPVYKTERSATRAFNDGDLYHDNCQCYAEQVFSTEQYEGSIFDLNREYARLWPEVTKGLGGKDAISAWRRFIRQQQKSRKSPEAAA